MSQDETDLVVSGGSWTTCLGGAWCFLLLGGEWLRHQFFRFSPEFFFGFRSSSQLTKSYFSGRGGPTTNQLFFYYVHLFSRMFSVNGKDIFRDGTWRSKFQILARGGLEWAAVLTVNYVNWSCGLCGAIQAKNTRQHGVSDCCRNFVQMVYSKDSNAQNDVWDMMWLNPCLKLLGPRFFHPPKPERRLERLLLSPCDEWFMVKPWVSHIFTIFWSLNHVIAPYKVVPHS